jgi:carboxypeptidase Q
MSNRFIFAVPLLVLTLLPAGAGPVEQLINAATQTNFAYTRLARLCDTFGPRFSGSTNLEAALDWILAEMKRDGLENVHGEDVAVPHWVRGAEFAEMLLPRPHALPMLGLGGSIGTPAAGITAEVLVVTNFADLKARPQDAQGKIVLFNQPFTTYGETVQIRYHGATWAAQAGAVASLIRSVTPFSIQSPHTGMMEYSNDVPKIPHAAITVEDAEMMARMQERGEKIVVRLTMSAVTLPDAPSRNIIAEVTGREHPEDVVIVSGHIDSWDVGQGAMDDGGGAMTAWETVRLMHALGLRARRTIRAVLWTNEENGLAGADAYERSHKDQLAHHVLAMESDSGVFRPRGFSFIGSGGALAIIKQFAAPLKQIGADAITTGEDEADVGELRPDGVPTLALQVDGAKYFWYHHTQADTIDKLDPHEISQCVAAVAAMAYQVADTDSPLPR